MTWGNGLAIISAKSRIDRNQPVAVHSGMRVQRTTGAGWVLGNPPTLEEIVGGNETVAKGGITNRNVTLGDAPINLIERRRPGHCHQVSGLPTRSHLPRHPCRSSVRDAFSADPRIAAMKWDR
jgi:hypothetical protein